MQNIKKRTFWLLAIVGLLFTITACSKSESNPNEMKISFANNSYEYVGTKLSNVPLLWFHGAGGAWIVPTSCDGL